MTAGRRDRLRPVALRRDGLRLDALRGLRRRLLAWYDRERRDLPWRRTRDPYAIWVSEAMLQQTRVRTVEDRWGRFLARFPDAAALARASRDDVLKEWEGLGYYGRARNLHRAAALVVERHGGTLPSTARALEELPGFGPYTAAAVASIAFGERVPVVDGNVLRVLVRWSGDARDPASAPVRAAVRASAAALLSPSRPGDSNQALMELGATVCTPRSPRCSLCPLSKGCRARLSGRPEALPRRRPRAPLPCHDVAAALAWRDGRVLIARRPPDGLLGGLWEFPGGKRREGETLEAACVREVREETGLDVRVTAPFLAIDHAYTHFRVRLHLFHCEAPRGRPRPLGCESPRFVPVGELSRYAFPRANRRALEVLEKAFEAQAAGAPAPPPAVRG